jgi:hypothetical protein
MRDIHLRFSIDRGPCLRVTSAKVSRQQGHQPARTPMSSTGPETHAKHLALSYAFDLLTVFSQVSQISPQRHFSTLTKFADVESRFCGRKRQREEVFYTPVTLCGRRPCSTNVAVGIYLYHSLFQKLTEGMLWNVDTGTRSGTLFACKITVFEVQEPRSRILTLPIRDFSEHSCAFHAYTP